ncbi:MAG: hypothetical protein AAGE65_10720 [Planctomycetota bacterium]
MPARSPKLSPQTQDRLAAAYFAGTAVLAAGALLTAGSAEGQALSRIGGYAAGGLGDSAAEARWVWTPDADFPQRACVGAIGGTIRNARFGTVADQHV